MRQDFIDVKDFKSFRMFSKHSTIELEINIKI